MCTVNRKSIRLLFNSPNPNLQGGMPTHLPLLEAELRKHITLETFEYGRKRDFEGIAAKIFGRLQDLLHLKKKILSFRPDLIHHNTAFDNFSLLRDAPLVWLTKRYKLPL